MCKLLDVLNKLTRDNVLTSKDLYFIELGDSVEGVSFEGDKVYAKVPINFSYLDGEYVEKIKFTEIPKKVLKAIWDSDIREKDCKDGDERAGT